MLRRDYRGNRASVDLLAGRLGLRYCQVKSRIQGLGCAQVRHYTWTEAEDELLRTMAGRLSVGVIAGRLGRSDNSVAVKLKRLGLSRRARDGWYTAAEAAQILGAHSAWVVRQIDSGNLAASSHTGHTRQSGSTWHIEEADLRRFIAAHADELTGRAVDIQQVVWILCPEGGGR